MLAPNLFNLFLDVVICMALSKYPDGKYILYSGDKIRGKPRKERQEIGSPGCLAHYDMAVVGDSMVVFEKLLRNLEVCCSGMDLIISFKKRKILTVHPSANHSGLQP